MIGKICKAITPFYDFKSHKMKNKSRPALVLAKADNEDYVVIPISKVSHSENIDSYYDVKIDPLNYPNTKLTQISYARTHKQTVIHTAELIDPFCDLKSEYPDLYQKILKKRAEFSKEIDKQDAGK